MSATITYPSTANMFADSKKITLDKINQGIGSGGSGGSGGVSAATVNTLILAARQVYYNRRPAAPNDPALDAVSFAPDGVMSQWIGGSGAWF